MNLSAIFIRRVVMTSVLMIALVLFGGMAYFNLPVSELPDVEFPTITVNMSLPGANPETMAAAVATPLERQFSGLPGLDTMSSTSSVGSTRTVLQFSLDRNVDSAAQDVQNAVSQAAGLLPREINPAEIHKENPGDAPIMHLILRSKTIALPLLNQFAKDHVALRLASVPGAGQIDVNGSQKYAVRLFVNPHLLAARHLGFDRIISAVQAGNSNAPAGTLMGKARQYTVKADGQLKRAADFANMVLVYKDGAPVRFRDIGRAVDSVEDLQTSAYLNGQRAIEINIHRQPGANTMAVTQGLVAALPGIRAQLPGDASLDMLYNRGDYIAESVHDVEWTLIGSLVLVIGVILLFLRSWMATLVVALVLPTSLIGTFGVMHLLHYSLDNISLLALTLSVGFVVDDAIVVIENVERIMNEEHLPPYEATVKAMSQITSAIIGITLVLIAVFIPMAFFPGSTGGIYRQFSLTLAISIAFSALLALTLTPALCATLLKPHDKAKSSGPIGQRVDRFFTGFNNWFGRTTDRYQGSVGRILSAPLRWLGIFLALVAVTALLFTRLPGSFLPQEDQGFLITVVQAPPGATTQRTDLASNQVKAFFAEQPQVLNTVLVRGFSFFGQGQANAIMFTPLKPWDERKGDGDGADAIAGKAMGAFMGIKEAFVFSLSPPSIPELGTSSGFTFKLQDRGGNGRDALLAARNQVLGGAMQSKLLANVRPEGQEDAPVLKVDIDRIQARALGLSIGDVNATLAIAFGSAYANDFTREGRVLRVLLQADAASRMTPQDVLDLKVRSATGEMVPFGSFSSAEWSAASPQLQRYNGYPAMTISGEPAPGQSTGEAMAEMERLAEQLPAGFSFEWTGISYEEKQSAGQIGMLLGLSLVVVFLLLAALYESWSVPVAVLLVVPLGVLGAVLFSMLRGLSADIYFNVGLITIIGLAAKNAILIVEFAIEQEAEGKSTFDAVMEAVKLRLRPIIMTSLAFILGMVPLVIASGAGAASRIAVGSGVMGGMIAATLLGVFFIPLFYLSVRKWLSRKRPPAPAEKGHHDAEPDHA